MLRVIAAVILLAVVLGAFATNLFANAWSILTARGFFIPRESSLLSFRVTVENPGSGEWWLYGEDDRNFYALSAADPGYWVMPRSLTEKCRQFDPTVQATWCAAVLVPRP